MTLDALAKIGEFAGAVAVLITLVYLGVETRRNNREVRDQTAWRITESLNQLNQLLGSDVGTATIWCRGNDDFTALSRIEREQYVVLVGMWANVLTALYRTKDTSAIPSEYFAHNVETFAIYYGQYPGFRQAMSFLNLPRDVLVEVERRIRDTPARPTIASSVQTLKAPTSASRIAT